MGTRALRMTGWSFKVCGNDLGGMKAPCMDPVWLGVVCADAMRREVVALRDAGFNALIVEGLRRLMLYEHNGVSAEVRRAVAQAVAIAHAEGVQVFYHSTCSFAAPSLEGFTERELAMLAVDGATGRHAFIPEWNGWYLWCMNNPDFRDEYFRLARLMVEETRVDGLMTDEVYFRTGWHDCVCPHCLAEFGRAIPAAADFDDPVWRQWLSFRMRSTGDFYQDLRRAVGGVPLLGCKNDEPNPTHSQYYGENNDERMRGTSILFTEVCTREGKAAWRPTAANCAAYQGLGRHYGVPVLGLAIGDTAGLEFAWALRMAHGIRPWGAGSALMRRSLSPQDNLSDNPEDLAEYARLFRWEDRYDGLFVNAVTPVADVALLLSSATRDQHDCRDHRFVREFHGWCDALTASHIQFAVVHEDELSGLDGRFAVLILPHAVCLPDFEFSGRIVATGDSGRRGPTGAERTPPRFERTAPLGEFDVAGLPTPIRVLEAPAELLVRAVCADVGRLVHLVNCGNERAGDIAVAVPGMAGATLIVQALRRAAALTGRLGVSPIL